MQTHQKKKHLESCAIIQSEKEKSTYKRDMVIDDCTREGQTFAKIVFFVILHKLK